MRLSTRASIAALLSLVSAPLPVALSAPRLSAEALGFGRSVNGSHQNSQVAGIGAALSYENEILRSTVVRLSGGAALETGSSRALYHNEFGPQQTLFAKEASLALEPKFLDEKLSPAVKAGALPLSENHSPILLGNATFPALQESLRYGSSLNNFGFRFEQAIANTQFTTNRSELSNQASPSFNSESLFAHLGSSWFESNASFGTYRFKGLNSSLAHVSRFGGNSVEGIGQDGSQFLYDYSGYETTLGFGLHFTPYVTPTLQGAHLFNEKSPETLNRGLWVAASLPFQFSKSKAAIKTIPSVEFFKLESDATVGAYSNKTYGRLGRTGFGLGLGLEIPESKTRITSRYVNSKTMGQNPFQSDAKLFILEIGSLYDLI